MLSLSEAGRASIEATIAEVEQRTAAELVVMEVRRSDEYGAVKLGYALAAALLAGGLTHSVWPAVPVARLLWLQLAAALASLALTACAPVLRLVVPKAHMQRAVDQRSRLAFFEHALFATRDRTGVLILLSEVERRVVILGDAGIHAKIQASGWQRHVDHIVQAIHAGRTEHGVCETLRAIGETLTAEFPRKPDDVDELPNAVRRDPR
jgi:putative membrane protein